MAVTFLHPGWLWGLLLIPLIFGLLIVADRRRKKAAVAFSSLGLLKGARPASWRVRLPRIFAVLILALLLAGLADPHLPLKQRKEGVNVVLSVDISGSMQATDYEPTRLEAAKSAAEILVDSLEAADQAGIVAFADGATTAAYLSPFKDKVRTKLRGIVGPSDGRTALGDGLALAVDMADSLPNRKKVVILLSDGVANAGVISLDEAIGYAKSKEIQVFTIGMGSVEPVVLGYDFFGRPQYAELDEAALKRVAQETGGQYFKSVDEETLAEVYTTLAKALPREREPTSVRTFVFAAALAVVLADLYLRYGRFRVIT